MHETLALGVASSGAEGSGHPAHGGQHHASPFEETQAAQEEVHRPSHDTGHACSDAVVFAQQCFQEMSLHLEARAAAEAQAA